jgi:hypothetical protein
MALSMFKDPSRAASSVVSLDLKPVSAACASIVLGIEDTTERMSTSAEAITMNFAFIFQSPLSLFCCIMRKTILVFP